ncbi:hypothetical protein NOH45_002698 [Salmonella enterica]|nr:hypothetical protein [Salmonella enterica subsp. enterica serovar Denver]ECD5430121.1 hypothetical protein [Salmonella enterica subsp. enterica serovar Denver]EJM3643768.1 hypothetical protein [Salmonella enterica]HCM3794222.1 hypothetical protein [Salmonella enterica subsp. enterica serovar Denver]
MVRRGLRFSRLPPGHSEKKEPAKTPAHIIAEGTLQELIAARFAAGKPVINIDANWNDALLLRVLKEAIRQARGQPFVVVPPDREHDEKNRAAQAPQQHKKSRPG